MIGRFAPCPRCSTPLSYLEGAPGASMTPKCPRCGGVVSVPRSTFLMLDHSRRASAPAPAQPKS